MDAEELDLHPLQRRAEDLHRAAVRADGDGLYDCQAAAAV